MTEHTSWEIAEMMLIPEDDEDDESMEEWCREQEVSE